jgi:hypothetical protein
MVRHAIVAHNTCHADAVVRKNLFATSKITAYIGGLRLGYGER